ncbi:hypothetical protein D9756_010053 [Leucocoprinus leucothites]|uniref:Uncharacterized protein n=1 Tax=Leucocoprinus leucothites TaxID=201217 RepID=A0A8H5CSZ6_9AGAR|nr:hypothetical protein D9756_010053 [Leucoagaricus leucothites]
MDIDSNDMDMDVDRDFNLTTSVAWVAPPSTTESSSTGIYDLYNDGEGVRVVYNWKKDDPSARIEPFYNRWPPSCTSSRSCDWICIDCGLSPFMKSLGPEELGTRFKMDYLGLKEEFNAITREGGVKVTPEMIDALAAKYGVLSGKWMVYSKPESVDQLWRKVVRVVAFDRGYGQVKVSARKVLDDPQCHSEFSASSKEGWNGGVPVPDESHVMCVDYTNKQEVNELRKALRFRAGVFWKIGFKPDVYTLLGVYKGNEWGLRPSRYHDLDYQSGDRAY